MKIIFFAALLCVLTCSVFAQKPDVDINISCGIAGQTDAIVKEYRGLYAEKKYDVIKNNLYSPSLYKQLLSTVTLAAMINSGQVKLSNKETKRLNEIKKSGKTYRLCFTSTGHYTGKFADIFNPDADQKPYDLVKTGICGKEK